MELPRPEYPRPRFVRDRWLNLNGPWTFAFGSPEQTAVPALEREIVVPFAPEWPLSGIDDRGQHTVVWYRRTFDVPAEWSGERVWLHFGAVDYACRVWVNDALVGTHEGGHTPFACDISNVICADTNTVVVRATDCWKDLTLPRGKQTWRSEPWGIFYTRTTGIWQSVWLEPVPEPHVVDLYVSSHGARVRFEIELSSAAEVEVTVAGRTVGASGRSAVVEMNLDGEPRWSCDEPNLIDVELRCGADRVRTYVGLRDISVDKDGVYLDGERIVQRLVLDQGYWPDGGLTAPSDEALAADVAWVKRLGFHGVRKHQKVEDPRWLHHCDRSGVLVWSEMANAYVFTHGARARLVSEWQAAVRRDRSHPCVVTWVPLNESWGVPDILTDPRQQAFARSLYHVTRSLDATRPVVDNDGWEHTTDTDLLTIHDYGATGDELRHEWSEGLPSGLHRPPLAQGATYRDQPVLVTEYGGISYVPDAAHAPPGTWGYGDVATGAASFVERFKDLTRALANERRIAGRCYTQLTDVEQETNGLLTFGREPKVDPDAIATVNQDDDDRLTLS